MIVDSHMHVWSMDDVDYYDDKTIYQYMQENAIDKTAIIAISEKENAEMKKVVQNEPDKFFGLGYVNVRDMYPSLKKLEEGVKGGWIRGIKLYPYAEHFMLDDDAINPVYETCLALDIPVLLHVGFQRPLQVFHAWLPGAVLHRARKVSQAEAYHGAHGRRYIFPVSEHLHEV